MSIYIKGVNLPEQGFKTLLVWCNGDVTDGRAKDIGKAVEVPPHGRLIDADAMAAIDNENYKAAIDSAISDSLRAVFDEIHRNVQNSITNADTIIPADPEEE